MALSNSAFAVLASVALIYTASATVGNRTVAVQVLDASGNIIAQTAAAAAITANQAPRLIAGGGLPSVSFAAPLMQLLPLPDQLSLPVNCSIKVLDSANIDANDQVAMVAIVAM